MDSVVLSDVLLVIIPNVLDAMLGTILTALIVWLAIQAVLLAHQVYVGVTPILTYITVNAMLVTQDAQLVVDSILAQVVSHLLI